MPKMIFNIWLVNFSFSFWDNILGDFKILKLKSDLNIKLTAKENIFDW